jgi:Asp-tRNA(Asn)/Glu-tRNA(Gln) amidotransferase A subunit family amidase
VLRGDAAAYHGAEFAVHAGEYRPKIRGLIEAGLKTPAVDYVNAQRIRSQFKREMQPIFERWDALLMPVAPTTAPGGFESTGDPSLCAPWSYGGLPSIALPSGLSRDRLPLAIQLAAGAGEEGRLLDVARWCEGVLAFPFSPPV